MTDGLDPWVVLYRGINARLFDPPLAFACRAEDGDHAEEQCMNAYPRCCVVWTHLGDVEDAYKDYQMGVEAD